MPTSNDVDFAGTTDRRWLQQKLKQEVTQPERLLPTALTSQFTCIDAETVARIEARHQADREMTAAAERIQRRADAKREASAREMSERVRGCVARSGWRRSAEIRKLESRLSRLVLDGTGSGSRLQVGPDSTQK